MPSAAFSFRRPVPAGTGRAPRRHFLSVDSAALAPVAMMDPPSPFLWKVDSPGFGGDVRARLRPYLLRLLHPEVRLLERYFHRPA